MPRRVYYSRRFPAPRPSPAPGTDPGPGPSPRSEKKPDLDAAVARINDLSPMLRTNWFGQLAFFGFVGVTLHSISDTEFFLDNRSISLPLVNISVETRNFFLFTPVISCAIYVYLHYQLLKLWTAMEDALAAAAPAAIRNRVNPWLVNDLALIFAERARGAADARPLAFIAEIATRLLIWAGGPLLLGFAWWRSMAAHDEWLTLTIAVSLGVSLYAGWTSWWLMRRHVSADPAPLKVWTPARRAAAAAVTVAIVALSWLRTEGGFEHYARLALAQAEAEMGWTPDLDAHAYDPGCAPPGVGKRIKLDCWIADHVLTTEDLRPPPLPLGLDRLLTLARTDFAGAEITPRPADWRIHEMARERFRAAWCGRMGHPAELCLFEDESLSAPPGVVEARRAACDGRGPACLRRFEAMDLAFATEWETERATERALLEGPDLSGLDLRGADFSGAFIGPANLSGARLEYADFTRAEAEGADFTGARLDWARLHRMHGEAGLFENVIARNADLSGLRFEGAFMRAARFSGSVLNRARLQGADLRRARFDEASMIGARLFGANLRRARFDGADVSRIYFDGADLRFARFDRVILNPRPSRGAALRGADFSGAYIAEASLLELGFGDASVKLPDWRRDFATERGHLLNLPGVAKGEAAALRHARRAVGEGGLAHWPTVPLENNAFNDRWRGWRASLGLHWPPPGRAQAFFRNLDIAAVPPDRPVARREIERSGQKTMKPRREAEAAGRGGSAAEADPAPDLERRDPLDDG
ncbi:MAG: pentapeptide repeat-containing protein [Pseudomonadota bacterium]